MRIFITDEKKEEVKQEKKNRNSFEYEEEVPDLNMEIPSEWQVLIVEPQLENN